MSDSLEKHRIEKLQQIKEAGFNPYGTRFPEGTPLAELAEKFDELEDSEVCGKGRILAVRNFGKATFIDIHDRTGKVQVYLKKGNTDDRSMELFSMLDIGDIIAARGKLGRTRTGEVTIFADSIDIMSKSLLPPPEKWHGLKDVEIRYRQRWVDLFSSHEVMEDFRLRTEIIRRIRNFLDGKGFLEVETPMMQSIPGGAAAKPFITHHNALDMDLYLRVSPEIFLKKLLVGGMERVYEINRSFRNEGISTRHNPEFTMIEIYQAYGNYIDMMDLTEGIILDALEALPEERKPRRIADAETPWPRRKYADLLKEYADLDISDEEAIKTKALDMHLDGIEGLPPQAVAHKIFEEAVEPNLLGPIFVTHYPVALCPLAKESAEEPGFAERFELYIDNMEVANAYSELNDALEQDKRFHHQIDTGEGELRMVDDSFVNALKYGMPPAGGLGIGIDRLMMLLLDRHSIRDVILFPLLKERGKTNV